MKKFCSDCLLSVFLFCTVGLFFVSCENSLESSSLKQQLEETINYANASCYSINISSKYGKISPNGTYDYKQTDKIELTFNADSDYQFICWKAFSDSSKETEVPAENFTFEKAENEKTTLYFKKALPSSSTIFVEPVCVKRPKVVTVSPLYDTDGVYRDRKLQ